MKLLKTFLSPISRLVKKDLVLFRETHHGSGSNVFALYTALVGMENLGLECVMIERQPVGWRQSLRYKWLTLRARWIVQDHGGNQSYPGQKVIELWHGIPLKAMDGMTSKKHHDPTPLQVARNVPDIVLSSSRLYETLLSACRFIPASRYRRFGFPRLRWLQGDRESARQVFSQAIGHPVTASTKLLVWMPTHRKRCPNGSAEPRFPLLFDQYLNDDLEQSLEKHDCLLVLKPHPNDERWFREYADKPQSRIKLLTSQSYATLVDDLYCLLPATDALITDYSSIYFDYLLLDKPIGFVIDDLDEYRRKRGFLLEPVTDWMPGHKIETSRQLIHFINDLGSQRDTYQAERDRLLAAVYPDGILDSAELLRRHVLK